MLSQNFISIFVCCVFVVFSFCLSLVFVFVGLLFVLRVLNFSNKFRMEYFYVAVSIKHQQRIRKNERDGE